MAVISTIVPTTELEALNAMLSAIGESPVSSTASSQEDVTMGLNLLRNTAREVQSVPWKFNFETSVQLAPTTTFDWVDVAGVHTTLNIFRLPSGVLSWEQSKKSENKDLDLTVRPSKQYQVAALPVLVLYDRKYNRDGAKASDFPYIYIDTISAFDFDQLPESARRYITVLAGRRFTQQVVGSNSLAGFQERDELGALRNLRRDQGEITPLNMLDNYTAFRMLGGR